MAANEPTRKLSAVIQDCLASWGEEITAACDNEDDEVAGDAMFRRGSYHLVGWGVFERSHEDAVHWLQMAVKRGYPAQKMLERVQRTDPNHVWKHWADD